MKKKQLNRTLRDVHQVLKKVGLPCCKEHMSQKVFGMNVVFKNFGDFTGRIGVFIDDIREQIVLSMSTPDKIPEENVAVVMNVINRFNNASTTEHLWMDRETNDVVVMKGIVLSGQSLDKEEFEAALMGLIGNGVAMLKAALEQVASDEKPEVLVNRILQEHTNHTHKFKENPI